MKQCWCIVIILVTILSMKEQVKSDDDDDDGGFIKTNGVQFMLNATPYYANGFNAYWLMYFASDSSQRNKVTSVFQQAFNNGLTMARTWAFSDAGYSPLQYSPGSYNERMFQGLDFVISEARKCGIKLILSLVNNYEDFGGKKQYVDWARKEGQPLSSEDDFFTNPVVKGYYKKHIQSVVTRNNTLTGVVYKDDTTIMAWELINEPRCNSDLSGKTLQDWITEMASYLKSIDGNHLLEIGLEGFYGQSSLERQQLNPNFEVGTDFIANNQISSVDFTTVHAYPDQWLSSSDEATQLAFLHNWIENHIDDAETVLRKPILFTEFGKSSKTTGFTVNKREQVYDMIYTTIYSSASRGGAAAGGMFWQLLDEGMDNFRDGYEVILSENPSTASLIFQHSQKLNKIRKMYAMPRTTKN